MKYLVYAQMYEEWEPIVLLDSEEEAKALVVKLGRGNIIAVSDSIDISGPFHYYGYAARTRESQDSDKYIYHVTLQGFIDVLQPLPMAVTKTQYGDNTQWNISNIEANSVEEAIAIFESLK